MVCNPGVLGIQRFWQLQTYKKQKQNRGAALTDLRSYFSSAASSYSRLAALNERLFFCLKHHLQVQIFLYTLQLTDISHLIFPQRQTLNRVTVSKSVSPFPFSQIYVARHPITSTTPAVLVAVFSYGQSTWWAESNFSSREHSGNLIFYLRTVNMLLSMLLLSIAQYGSWKNEAQMMWYLRNNL